ncbi:MAG: FtsQ-type POTRA domain-containing protein [Novosphingobium sp.]|nr:FtsQ-type POTRA domain-containing protein [Novosphingobium sp.]
MAQTIRRGGKGVRRAAAARTNKARVARARRTTGSALDRALGALPVSEARLQQAFLAMILGGAAVLAWMVASMAGVPTMAAAQLAALAGDAGFEVRRVEVRGVERMNELKVYEKVLAERDRAMPLVDLQRLRDELLQLSWVEDARVSRQLPDTLVVDIIERRPRAVLKKPGRYVLIDARGHELEPVKAERAKTMLTLAGPGAGRRIADLDRLLEAAPALKPQVREAEWVGNRRWNLTFRTGQVLALPQGEEPSASALVSFAKMDGVNRLLGGQVAYFDMRAPDRIYLRVPGRAQQAAKDAAAKAAAKTAAKAKAAAD